MKTINSNKEIFFCIIVLILILFIFFYVNPIGIKIGYFLSGGIKPVEQKINTEEMARDYEEYVATYNLYKNSTNPTSQQWAENAKLKANRIANEYNYIMEKDILKIIGE